VWRQEIPQETQIDSKSSSVYPETMEVRLNSEQEALLSQIARRDGKEPGEWLKDVALQAIDENERFRVAVREGLAQAANNEWVEDDAVRQWLEQRERG
jgi:predicted transcriptional regulator